jgi:hypothetical protein
MFLKFQSKKKSTTFYIKNMRSKYWSCSKFADWIRGMGKPPAETSEGWAKWRVECESKHPIRYWIAEEGLDNLQNALMFIPDKIYSVKYALVNRFVTRTHTLSSNLKKYRWHEYDTRMLHCLFDELVNFVEVELAAANFRFDEEARKKYKVPLWGTGWFRTRTYRNKEAGLDYLAWASNLKNDESWGLEPGDEGYGEPTYQAKGAQETLILYKWWTEQRPARPDPYDISGWSEWCERRREDSLLIFAEDKTEEEREETVRRLDRLREIETQYETEDEEMLIRLVKIRKYLWT